MYSRHFDNLHFLVLTSFLGHLRPPFCAGTLIVLVLVITPRPQVTLHWLQFDQADTIQSIAGPRLGSCGWIGGLGFNDFPFPFFLPFLCFLLFFLRLFFLRFEPFPPFDFEPFPPLGFLFFFIFLVLIVVTLMSPSIGVMTSFLEFSIAK